MGRKVQRFWEMVRCLGENWPVFWVEFRQFLGQARGVLSQVVDIQEELRRW